MKSSTNLQRVTWFPDGGKFPRCEDFVPEEIGLHPIWPWSTLNETFLYKKEDGYDLKVISN